MILFVLAFLAGNAFLQAQSNLFTLNQIVVAWILLLLFVTIFRQRLRYFVMIIAFLCGLSWTEWQAVSSLSFELPKAWVDRPVLVTGYVMSLPVSDDRQVTFVLKLHEMRSEYRSILVNTKARVTWRGAHDTVKVGDERQLLVKLRRIHGTQNPGSFDLEAWALQNGLRASGSVMPSDRNMLLARHPYRYPIESMREWLSSRLSQALPHSQDAHWLMTLMLGEHHGVTQDDWRVLRKTGTNHLMAVAGLHIGVVAGLVRMLVSVIWRCVPLLMLRIPVSIAAAWASLLAALSYAALAGFSIPAQRASLMLCVFLLADFLRREIFVWHVWSLAMMIVLLINPLTTLSESFWLSFGTIALIVYGMAGRINRSSLWWKWGRVQWVIGFGLIPLSLWFYQDVSLVSFLVNCIAIPWLEFLILPFCFLAMVVSFISLWTANALLGLAAYSLHGLWVMLSWFSALPLSAWSHAISSYYALFCLIVGSMLLLAPAGLPGRWLGLLWFLPLFYAHSSVPASGEVYFSLIDVGQGLSAVVQTHSHVLLYDAGPSFAATQNSGESIVLPFLRVNGISQIDALVVSHGDNDHLGGVRAVLDAMPVKFVLTSVPDKLSDFSADYCLSGYSWQWDGVSFKFLYPSKSDLMLGNDSSCVLQVDNGVFRILLPGDIEKFAEYNLLAKSSDKLFSDILIAPHHGSKTSAVNDFVDAVHPRYVLYATGYHNRYGFPHQSVVNEYQSIHSLQFDTAHDGAMFFKVGRDGLHALSLYRQDHRRYWYDVD